MEMFIVAALAGVLIGILSGLLGIGGGTLMVPLFRLGFGMSALASTATSLFAIIPTSLVGFVTHLRNKTCIPRLGLACGLAGACMSPAGVYLATLSPGWLVMVVAAFIVGYSSYTMFRKALRMPKVSAQNASAVGVNIAQAAEAAAAAQEPDPPFSLTRKRVLIALAIGLVAGLASGYVGVGGGFIMVPLFLSLLDVPMRKASGTSLVAVTILAIPGVVEQAILGNINYAVGIAIALGSIPGAVVGANLVRRVPERKLRFLFAAFLLVAAVVLIVNEFAPAL